LKPTRIVVSRGVSVNQETGEVWSRAEYTVEVDLEGSVDLDGARRSLSGLIQSWLEAETMSQAKPVGGAQPSQRDVGVLVAEALRKAQAMKDKPGKWAWSRDHPGLKAALLDQEGKLRLNVDGVVYDVKLGDSKEERDAFISFWPRSGR